MPNSYLLIFVITSVSSFIISLFMPAYRLREEGNRLYFSYFRLRALVRVFAYSAIVAYLILRTINGCYGEFCEFNTCSNTLNSLISILFFIFVILQAVAEIKALTSKLGFIYFDNSLKNIFLNDSPYWSYSEVKMILSKKSNNPLCPGRQIYAENISGETFKMFCLELDDKKLDVLLNRIESFTGLKVTYTGNSQFGKSDVS